MTHPAENDAACNHVAGYYTNPHSGATCWDCGEVPDAEKDASPVEALADLIDHWWENADQPTMRHDGVEYVASLALAQFLVANGCQVTTHPIPPAETEEADR